VSDYEEAKELATVKAQVNLLLKESDEVSATQREVFTRLGMLERRMAQILGIAIILGMVVPITVESVAHHLRATVSPTNQRR